MPKAHIDLAGRGIKISRDGVVRAQGLNIGRVVKINPTENTSEWMAYDEDEVLLVRSGGGNFAGQREAAKALAERAGVWS